MFFCLLIAIQTSPSTFHFQHSTFYLLLSTIHKESDPKSWDALTVVTSFIYRFKVITVYEYLGKVYLVFLRFIFIVDVLGATLSFCSTVL